MLPQTHKKGEPPLVDIKVTNPITYLKKWWQKVIGNEGVDFRFRIRPLTAIAIAIVIASIGFGVGHFVFPFSVPFFKYETLPTSSPSTDLWKDTGFIGTLQYSQIINRYYLITTSSEAINLEVPTDIDLKDLIGKRVFAAGKYNKTTRILQVSDAKNMEVLPKDPVPVPTINPILIPTPTNSPIPTSEATSSPSTPIPY